MQRPAVIGEQPGRKSARARSPAPSASRTPTAPSSSACCANSPTTARREAQQEAASRRHSAAMSCSPISPAATRDGELIAVPTEWDEDAHGAAPKIRVRAARARVPARSPASATARCAGRGHRRGRRARSAYRGRVIKIIDQRQAARARHLPRAAAAAAAGWRRSTRRSSAASSRSRRAPARTRRTAIWSRSRSAAAQRLGLPTARVIERLGSLGSEKAVSLIAIHAHGIPHVFRRERWPKPRRAKPASLRGREDWRDVAARHHRSARRQGP